MTKIIEFTDNQSNSFRPITLSVQIDAAATEQNLYLHKCLKEEYVEIPDLAAAQSGLNGTVYFITKEAESSTSQLNSNRTDQATKEEALSGQAGTLYFVQN